MAFLVSRRLVYPDGSYGGTVYVNRPSDGSWVCFGFDGFCQFIYSFDADCVTSFRMSDGDNEFDCDVYSFPLEFYRYALEILD